MQSGSVILKSELCISRFPLLKGEGGPKGRVRGKELPFLYPSPAASRHPLPSGEGFVRNLSPMFSLVPVPGLLSHVA
jgi:hypothetical protein